MNVKQTYRHTQSHTHLSHIHTPLQPHTPVKHTQAYTRPDIYHHRNTHNCHTEACSLTHTHTYTQTQANTCTHSHSQIYTHTHTHSCTHHTHKHAHTSTLAHRLKHIHTLIYTLTHTQTCTHIQTHMLTYTFTHIHTLIHRIRHILIYFSWPHCAVYSQQAPTLNVTSPCPASYCFQ